MPSLPPLQEARDKLLTALERCFVREPRVPWSVWLARQYSSRRVPQSAHEIVSEYEEKLMAEWKAKLEPVPPKWSDIGSTAAKPKPAAKQKPRANSWPTLRAALQAHSHMCCVLADASRTPRARWTAISAWVAAVDVAGMGDIFSADFLALLAAADKNIELERSQ